MTTTAVARDARPPLLLVKIMNPVLRWVLRTPLGRLIRPVALLEFVGCRGGRFRIPVGWHAAQEGPVIVTPARWRRNLREPTTVRVYHRGRKHRFIATLDEDPASVAVTLQSIADRHDGSLRAIGVDMPPGHLITQADVDAVDRAVIRLTPN
jgi:hypothetical protein